MDLDVKTEIIWISIVTDLRTGNQEGRREREGGEEKDYNVLGQEFERNYI